MTKNGEKTGMTKEKKRMMITAHSGCDGTEENSVEFILYALKLPVDAIEVDVRKNSRGQLILSHDEMQEEAVGLAQAFTLLKEYPDKRINCDLKQPGLEEGVAALAKRHGVEKQLIFTGDVNPEGFLKGEVRYPEILWFANIDSFWPEYEAWMRSGATEEETQKRMEQVLKRMLDYETQGLNWNYKDAEKVFEKAREMGIGISVWTVNEQEQQELWIGRQVENITTRRPSQVIRLRDGIISGYR